MTAATEGGSVILNASTTTCRASVSREPPDSCRQWALASPPAGACRCVH